MVLLLARIMDKTLKTHFLLSKYIDEIETQVDKSKAVELFQTVYKEILWGRVVYLLAVYEEKTKHMLFQTLGEKVLYLFEEEDDAERYVKMLEENSGIQRWTSSKLMMMQQSMCGVQDTNMRLSLWMTL